jgi:hypothetical protein
MTGPVPPPMVFLECFRMLTSDPKNGDDAAFLFDAAEATISLFEAVQRALQQRESTQR